MSHYIFITRFRFYLNALCVRPDSPAPTPTRATASPVPLALTRRENKPLVPIVLPVTIVRQQCPIPRSSVRLAPIPRVISRSCTVCPPGWECPDTDTDATV